MFKKLIVTIGLVGAFAVSANAAVLSTNIATGAQAYILLATNANVYQVQLLSSVNPVIVDFYDSKQITAPAFGTNYTNATFVSKTTFATNIVTENIGSTGTTNYLTNVGVFTLLVTNTANTNQLPKVASFAVGANGAILADTDLIFARGVSVRPSTNVTVILYYRQLP